MEFSLGILLHKGQVDLTGHFMSKAVSGQSMCHQVSSLSHNTLCKLIHVSLSIGQALIANIYA
jgi:hypothetical protein